MKKRIVKQMISFAIAGAMILSSVPFSVNAENTRVMPKGSETIAGEAETVQLSGSIQDAREANFNEGWKFHLGTSSTAQNPGFDDSKWENVNLPHDFSIQQEYTTRGEAESGFLPGGTGWYRKKFILPESFQGKRVVINFDGVYEDAHVYVNGNKVGEHHYGYTAFAFDITKYLTCDGVTENVIAVKAVHNLPSSRWYSGSGIYRDVTLVTTNQVYVDYRGTQVTTPKIASGNGTVHVKADVVNNMEAVQGAVQPTIKVKNTVYTKAGQKVSTTVEKDVVIASGNKQSVETDVVVTSPKLWSIDTPNLYYVRTEVWVDGTLTDSYDTTFGFRYISFDKSYGFKLNGKNVKLNGVCLHHDQGALGSAASYDAMYRQLSIMKDMGANAIRTSHNPADEDFIDICNELGLLVIEEAFDGWSNAKNHNSNDFSVYFKSNIGNANVLGGTSNMTWAEYALKSMVLRDRNDPSIIMWSLGNEIQEGSWAGEDYPQIAQNLINWIKDVDTTRKPTIGSNQRTTSGILGNVHQTVANNQGIVGFNYASEGELDSMSNAYGVILASETSSAVNSRGRYMGQASNSDIDGKYHLTSYDTSAVPWGKTAHDSLYMTMTRDHVMGEFIWTGFDYLGEPTPWNNDRAGSSSGKPIPNSSYFGIVETTGFEKDTYYFYRSQWNQSKNTLHLVTAWDKDNMINNNGKTPVVIYSNAPKVKLYRDGSLIGTATRKVNTTAAGYKYYTYTVRSNNSSVCSAASKNGSESLYATFNVAYKDGTISAKAYDSRDQLLNDVSGKTEVKTAGTPSRLNVQTNKTAIDANGNSLAYISVDVEDANRTLDTTATNNIKFTLTGNGEIVGVDNGDQATTKKYQQASVLTSKTSATIDAFAGKALVIVRSTKDAGSIKVNAASNGLTAGSVTIKTNPVDNGQVKEGLVSYTMVRDYTVKVGTNPVLQTTVTGTMADKTTVNGTITWENIPETTYQTPGDHILKGTATFPGVQEPLKVTCRLHVIGNVIALRNVSTATAQNTVPVLPDKVEGFLADGTVCGEFVVKWDAMTANQFATIGDKVIVNGNATIFGTEKLPVTASIRVAEIVNKSSENIASSASDLSQNIEPSKQADVLESIRNGNKKPGDNVHERWSNWGNRTTSNTAELTFRWDTVHSLDSVNMYYYYDGCAAYPENIAFAYSENGTDFKPITAVETKVEEYGNGAHYSYAFDKPISPIALKVILTQQGGTSGAHCVALTELEIMTYAGKIDYNNTAELSNIFVDGKALTGFTPNQYRYTAKGSKVTAESAKNAGITVLPVNQNMVRIMTISEDASKKLTYEVEVAGVTCPHTNTELVGAIPATCTENGYTGDTTCLDCKEIVIPGTVIQATGHSTILVGVKEPTCDVMGYTGDEKCTICQTVVKQGSHISPSGHKYNAGVITKDPTITEPGVKTYTCQVCGATKTESIPKLPNPSDIKEKPTVQVSAKATSTGRIALTGKFVDFQNIDKYYEVVSHGIVYYNAFRLGSKDLTLSTPGRTRVNFTKYGADGSFTYNMRPSYPATRYAVRAFLSYKDENGKVWNVYSDTIRVSLNGLR